MVQLLRPTDSGRKPDMSEVYIVLLLNLHMSVGSRTSRSAKSLELSSQTASINCHLCGANFKVWYELINHFVATIRTEKDKTKSESQK